MRDLDYQGLDLPILTDKELLEQTWNLEDQPEQTVPTNDQGGLGEVGEGEADERGRPATGSILSTNYRPPLKSVPVQCK